MIHLCRKISPKGFWLPDFHMTYRGHEPLKLQLHPRNLPRAELEGKPEDVMLKKANIFTIGMQKSSVTLCQKFRLGTMSPHICTRKKILQWYQNNMEINSVWRRDGREGIWLRSLEEADELLAECQIIAWTYSQAIFLSYWWSRRIEKGTLHSLGINLPLLPPVFYLYYKIFWNTSDFRLRSKCVLFLLKYCMNHRRLFQASGCLIVASLKWERPALAKTVFLFL